MSTWYVGGRGNYQCRNLYNKMEKNFSPSLNTIHLPISNHFQKSKECDTTKMVT